MRSNDRETAQASLIELLENRLADEASLSRVIDGYEQLARQMTEFMARHLGAAGARAIMARSTQLSARDVAALDYVKISAGGVDFGEFRDHVPEMEYAPSEVTHFLNRQLGGFQHAFPAGWGSNYGSFASVLGGGREQMTASVAQVCGREG